jgi:hypothetical protein
MMNSLLNAIGLQGAVGSAQNVAGQQYAANQYTMAISNAAAQQHTGKIVGNVAIAATSKELDHEAYNTSIENLINLWITRFGNEWIDLATIEDEEFFNLAYRRLKQMGELEVHYLTDRARYVCRRPE